MFLVLMVFVTCCVVRLLNCCTWQLSTVIFHTKQVVIVVVEQKAFFLDLRGSARLMWSSLADHFSSLFMTVSGKLIVFNSYER